VVHQNGSSRKRRSEDFSAEALEEIHKVKWIPSWGEDRMYEMIEHRPIGASRASASGARLSSFFIARLRQRLEDFKALRNVIEWFKKEGADAWYKHSAEELLPRVRNALVPVKMAQGK